MPTLTAARRRELRAAAHSLHPVVAIGQHGLTAAVLHELDVALLAHELIKVRVFDDDRDARETLMTRICTDLQCAPVQHIGKLLVLWRANPEKHRDGSTKTTVTSSGAVKGAGGAGIAKRAGAKSNKPGAGPRSGAARASSSGAARKSSRMPRRLRAGEGAEDPAAPIAPRGDQSRKRARAALPEVPRAPQSRRRRAVKS
jgi:putative YhbY family RNA-binding protein